MSFLGKLLGGVSGDNSLKLSDQLLFDKIIGFRNIVPGCGASTILQNVAIALKEHTSYNICVVDTNYLYPVQYSYLGLNETKKNKDLLEYVGDLSEIMTPTNYTNIYLVHLKDRNVVDMLSGKDEINAVNTVFDALKTYFDIVLVDLSNELTNVMVASAIKCNKIIQVADTSFKCVNNLQKSLNFMTTLAVPLAKSNQVVINKDFEDMNLGTSRAAKEVGLDVIGTIPFSKEIYIAGITGRKIYEGVTPTPDITEFRGVINVILDSITEQTPLNRKYQDIKTILQEQEHKEKLLEKYGEEIIDTNEDYDEDFEIEELGYDEYKELQRKKG